MATINWPSRLLVPSSEAWRIEGGSRSGGQSLTGAEQVVVGPSGRWRASLTVPINRRDKLLAYRAIAAGLDGRANSLLIGPMEVQRAPWWIDPIYGKPMSYGVTERAALTDPAYATHPDTASTLNFRSLGGAPINNTNMVIQRDRGGLLAPGQFFSIAARLYMITALTTPDPIDPDTGLAIAGAIGIQFRPWLRDEIAADTLIEFGQPSGLMRLASDDTGSLELQLSRFGSVTLDLVEAF